MAEREDVQVIESIIQSINDRDVLIGLNKSLIRRIREIDLKVGIEASRNWNRGDRATWDKHGITYTGTVIRVNPKTLGIREDGSLTRWRVSFSHVKHLDETEEDSTEDSNRVIRFNKQR